MTNFKDFPFTAQGINFISRVDTDSPLFPRINSLPAGMFEQVNIDAITEIIGNASTLTREELLIELDRVNAGGSYAFILLGENN